MTSRTAFNKPPGHDKLQRRNRLLVVILLALLALALGWYGWREASAPEPPVIALENLEPEVAATIADASAGVKDSPRSGQAWGRLGMILYAHGALAEAAQAFGHAVRFDSKNGKWSYFLGQLLLRDDPAAAQRHLQHAADHCDDPTPRLLLGEYLFEQGQNARAESQFRLIFEKQPANPRARFGLARIAIAQDDLASACDHLRAATSSTGVHAVHALLAETYDRLGDATAAARQLQILERLPPEHTWPDPLHAEIASQIVGVNARLKVAQHHADSGRIGDAWQLLRRTVQDYPTAFAPHVAMAHLHLRTGNVKAAELALREAIRLKGDAANIHFDLGLILEQNRRYGEASECYRAVLRLKPYDADAHFRLARCLKTLGDAPRALASYQAALDCNPGHVPSLKACGELFAEQGKYEEAVAVLEKAALLMPTDTEIRNLLERVRQKTNLSKQ